MSVIITQDRFLSGAAVVYTRMSIPTVMRALVQTSLRGVNDLRLETVPVPVPGRGEVLIRVAAAGVNFVDIARAHGTFGDNPQAPFVAGFEAAGEVVARGEGAECPHAHVVGAGPGAFAEYMVLPASAAMPLPAGWTAQQALGLVINWPTAIAALTLGRLAAGETVLVHAAAGATGQAIVTLANHRGARVIATASPGKLAGALDARDPALAAAVLERTGGRGADLVIESAGGETFHTSLAATRRITGRVVVIGLAGGEATISNWDLVYKHQVQVLGFNLGVLIHAAPHIFGEVMGELGALIAAEVIQPARPRTYALADGPKALAALERRETTGKLALIP